MNVCRSTENGLSLLPPGLDAGAQGEGNASSRPLQPGQQGRCAGTRVDQCAHEEWRRTVMPAIDKRQGRWWAGHAHVTDVTKSPGHSRAQQHECSRLGAGRCTAACLPELGGDVVKGGAGKLLGGPARPAQQAERGVARAR